MITGAHITIYSKDAEVDRAFFREILNFPDVDAGHGWLIFRLPPTELGVHPADKGGGREFYLMCNDIEAFIRQMAEAGRDCEPVRMLPWGALTMLTLPSGAKLGVYQPRHERP
jgi:catechol 2,3-dioxygenase-like lactoylglutathione lyase family enzyme